MTKMLNFGLKIKGGGREGVHMRSPPTLPPIPPEFETCTNVISMFCTDLELRYLTRILTRKATSTEVDCPEFSAEYGAPVQVRGITTLLRRKHFVPWPCMKGYLLQIGRFVVSRSNGRSVN